MWLLFDGRWVVWDGWWVVWDGWLVVCRAGSHMTLLFFCYIFIVLSLFQAGIDKLDGRVDDTSVSRPCVLFWQGCIRIASAMAGLSGIWRCNTISFTSKFRFYKSLVTSILLFGCEI